LRSVIALLLFALACRTPPTDTSCTTGALGIEPGAFSPAGVTIAAVLPGSPAEGAGFREGDVVQQVGDRRIEWSCEVDALVFDLDCQPVRVVVTRDGQRIEQTVTPTEQGSFYEKACEGGNATACFRLTTFASHSDRRNELSEEACRNGSADACAQYGYLLMSDDLPEAVKVLEDGCDRRSGAACTHLAYLYAVGKIVERDDLRSLEFYTRGCSFGDANGCYNQGLMRDQGRGFAMSAASAAPAYEEACNKGVSKACTNLGYLYEHGKGVRRDPVRATGFYRRGCEGSPCEPSNLRGCVNVGNAYRDGIGVDKNPTLAAETFRKACETRIDPPDEEAEKARLRACVLLGALEIHGLGVPEDVEGGVARSLDGCNRGDAYGCFNVGAMRAYREDFTGAAKFYDKACNGGDAEACYELGKLYDEAKGVAFDHEMKTVLFARACKGGFLAACSR